MTDNGGAGDVRAKAWGGRFMEVPDARLEAFNASVTFDIRLVSEDIRGSIAHARMLGAQGIIPVDDAEALELGLWRILDEVEAGEFVLTISDEDVHTGVERRLRELVGQTAGKLHTGRSRNDQVVNDVRFWTRQRLASIVDGLNNLCDALLDLGERYRDAIMPGYTHLQRAQPVLVAHHMQAYVAMFQRDIERIRQAWARTNVLALGSAALAGTTYPIDREMVAKDLGFAEVSINSLDAVSDRDFVIDTLSASAVIGMHVSRLSEEVILWTSGEFRFMELADRFSTGSSIMPQKKNADIAELGRGKSGRLYGNLMALLTITKGLPLAFNKDMQEDKEPLFDSIDTVLAILEVFPPMMQSATFDKERMATAAVADFTLATDAADLLAKHGVPFREAHHVVGSLVGKCVSHGKTFADLTDEEWTEIHPVFSEARPPVDAWTSVAGRDSLGGTSPAQVERTRGLQREALESSRQWVAERLAAERNLFQRS
ncbi:MAG TPA: argininosuccinate lyase [Thermomicrobiales bacterium]|nr:argininosuccinate lyase [Thermomicrobiales bacterium]